MDKSERQYERLKNSFDCTQKSSERVAIQIASQFGWTIKISQQNTCKLCLFGKGNMTLSLWIKRNGKYSVWVQGNGPEVRQKDINAEDVMGIL
eukprot:CAMPEP_0202712754 /NCGR_PEP_ID=MMETSP1385-20130828/44993_1 /ASSEMBLY_ACC=CAM_ASM_000861 /TAXON_ID=933848 /ORGANISM="Elphidium margaritaceum" /LENGTH=92 /DNA_ID=CAMNT_0049372883 /DNA_START=56 /DNA_END=331 /DNA_ORIENTATION=+